MKIYESLPDDLPAGSAVSIGKFDGFHRGHRLLLDEAKKSGRSVSVFTFRFPTGKTIDSYGEKRELAKALGVDVYIEVAADERLFSMSAHEFIHGVICDRLHAGTVIVGEDFRFGENRSGDVHTLEKYKKECGYDLIVKKKLMESGEPISSSRVRELIASGKMEEAYTLLGRCYHICGKVISGNRIGRTMGVPTANVIPDEGKVLPPNGVYAVTVICPGDKSYTGVADLGVKPTIDAINPGDKDTVGLEVNLFDYTGDLYDKDIKVEFGTFLRKEKQFSSLDELHTQIEKDVERARKWHQSTRL